MHIISKKSLSSSLGVALAISPILLGACGKVEGSKIEDRVAQLESREQIRSTLLEFAAVVDSGERARLAELGPKLHAEFSMDVIDFAGGEHRFVGLEELVEGYGPIMASAQANLAASAIAVELDGEQARATFKFINSVLPPPELNLDIEEKVLLFAANTAIFVREGEAWKLKSIELDHTLAYPGTLPVIDE
ncbi:MAG: nuclear transport factor 2 family protein [Enhygromyxa sp.]